MPNSQNVRFSAQEPSVAEDHFRGGATLLGSIRGDLITAGWSAGELQDWRDCGWCVSCRRTEAEIIVIVSEIKEGEWMLQVAPLHLRGLIGMLFGFGKPSATSQDVFDAASTIHSTLTKLEYVTGPQLWVWDGFPEVDVATHSPSPPRDSA